MGVFRGYIVWWFSAENCHCNTYIWYKATLLGVIQPQSLWHYKPQHENVKIDPQECLAHWGNFPPGKWINLCIISETKSRGSVNISVAWNTSAVLLLCQYYLSFIYTQGSPYFHNEWYGWGSCECFRHLKTQGSSRGCFRADKFKSKGAFIWAWMS